MLNEWCRVDLTFRMLLLLLLLDEVMVLACHLGVCILGAFSGVGLGNRGRRSMGKTRAGCLLLIWLSKARTTQALGSKGR
jgi:hypothetical protein